jgi:hypothetical protein
MSLPSWALFAIGWVAGTATRFLWLRFRRRKLRPGEYFSIPITYQVNPARRGDEDDREVHL